MASILTRVFGSRNQRLLRQYGKIVKQINALEEGVQALDDAGLRARTEKFKGRFAGGETIIGGCSALKLVAKCEMPSKVVKVYYAPFTTLSAQSDCAGIGGRYWP